MLYTGVAIRPHFQPADCIDLYARRINQMIGYSYNNVIGSVEVPSDAIHKGRFRDWDVRL